MTTTIEWHMTSKGPPKRSGYHSVYCHQNKSIDRMFYSRVRKLWLTGNPEVSFEPDMWAELPWPEEER